MDCSGIPVSVLETLRGSQASQYIYNHMYQWTTIDIEGKRCVFLNIPFQRGLTREEVRMLMSASTREWPVAPDRVVPLSPEDQRNADIPIDRAHMAPDHMRIDNPPACIKQKDDDCR
jgi:hypothetical protein